MRHPSFASLSRSCLVILVALLGLMAGGALTPAAAVRLDAEFNKNGEVYVLLRDTTPGGDYARPGIYKTCEYQVDDTGQRSVIVAKPNNIGQVKVTRGQSFDVNNYGIAVNKDRVCYTFTNEVSDTWRAAGPEWKVKAKALWLVGNECTNSHFSNGHGRGTFAWYTDGTTWGASRVNIPVNPPLSMGGTYDPAGGGRFTTLTGNTVVFPCSIRHRNWTTGPWPDPVGAFTWETVNGARVARSNSNEYMMPMGMSFHNLNDSARRHGLPFVYFYMGALKPTNLRMHHWVPLGGFTPWTAGSQTMPPYEDRPVSKVVFQLFDARYHIYITTPCGDACLSGASSATQPAGNSAISVTITPFGRAYGLQVVKNTESEMISIKRYDPGSTGDPIEYLPANWTTKNPRLHLVTIRTVPGSTLSNTNWSMAKRIATSYKYAASEVVGDFNTKQEYVYLSDSDYFCVADTWFGDGGRAFFGKNIEEGGKKGALLTSQTRDEIGGRKEEKYFKVFRKVQDISADGYGNLFVLVTTGLQEVEELMDANIADFNDMKTKLTRADEWGYTVVDPASYNDSGWYNVDTRRMRDIKFDLIVYKTIYKIASNSIDDKGATNAGGAKDIFREANPTVVGQLKVGRVPCKRIAELVGGRTTWSGKLTSPAITEFPAELAAINIAAPPEEQGVNYYVDIKGPTTGTTGAGQKDRASRSTDTIHEGEEGVWSMENAPEFDEIYGLNIKNGISIDDDQNKNGVVGSLRNNVIKESLVAHWKVYRLYNIEALALPDPPVENETVAAQKAAGKYDENLLLAKTLIYPGTGAYARKKGGTNQSRYGSNPGFATSTEPFTLRHSFKEAGIYKVTLEVDFDYYEYWRLAFGSNRGARENVKQSSEDLSVPAFFKSQAGFPVFNHRADTRFVVVVARDALADDDHIRKVKVTAMKKGSENPLASIEVPEVDRSRDVARAEIASLFRASVNDRHTELTETEVDKQRMEDTNIVGDFAIRFASALPGIGDDATTPANRNAVEKFGGIGVYDYDPDEVWNYNSPVGRDETTGGPLKAGPGTNALHPPNWKSGSVEADVTTFQVFKYDDATKDRLAFVKRNYGMHGHGTLVRALSQAKLDAMQINMDPKDPHFLKVVGVPPSQWNGNDGARFPIREIDWDNVRYQWTIDYLVDGAPRHEEPAAYGGTVAELLRAYWNTRGGFDGHAFIARLGSKSYPDGSVPNPRNIFNEDPGKPAVDIDTNNIPAFHVRIPMLERVAPGVYKPIRWETPIAPETYKIGLRIWAPSLKWQKDEKHQIDDKGAVPAGAKKQVFWDLVNDRTNVAKCDPLNGTSLKGVNVWVIDREPPRFARVGAKATTPAMFSFTGGTTADKYVGKPMEFTLVENNPNLSAAAKRFYFLGGKTEADDGFSVRFPIDLPAGGSSHTTERHMFGMKDGDYQIADNAPGNCFFFEIDKTKEQWGAPFAIGTFLLPVGREGRTDAQVTEDDLTTFDPKSTPFMPPDYIGNLPYAIDFKVPKDFLAQLKAAPEAGVLTIPPDYTPGMFFEVADNDPPQIFVDVVTSFTEIDKFGFAGFDDSRAKYNFAERKFELDTYRALLNGNSPKDWPAALVDRLYPPAGILKYGNTAVLAKSDKEILTTIVSGAVDDRTVEVSTIKVFVPEKSRAIFTVRAVDNVPRGGSYIVDLSGDQFQWEMNIGADANDRYAKEITTGPDVADPKAMNVYGIFRLPNAVATESNLLKVRVADGKLGEAGSNQSEVHIHVNVVNTFMKQEKLDMENRRLD